MVKFFGILVLIVLPVVLVALYLGRRMEDNDSRHENDQAIRDGMRALKRRVLNLEKLRNARREKEG